MDIFLGVMGVILVGMLGFLIYKILKPVEKQDYKKLEESLQRGAEILKKLDSDNKLHNASYFYGKDMRNEEIEELNDIIDRNSHTIEYIKTELRKTLNKNEQLEFQNGILKEELEQMKKYNNSDKYYDLFCRRR